MIKRIIGSIFFLLFSVVLFPSITALEKTQKIIYIAALPEVVVTARHQPFIKLTKSVLEKIMDKETPNRNPSAKGDTHLVDFALGIIQIRMCCVRDVNKTYGTNYTSEDRLNVQKSIEIYHLYLEKGIILYLKKYNRIPTKIEVQAMWNGGIYNGYQNAKALRYARR